MEIGPEGPPIVIEPLEDPGAHNGADGASAGPHPDPNSGAGPGAAAPAGTRPYQRPSPAPRSPTTQVSDLLELLAPDAIEPLVGWRYWRAEGGWLASLNRFQTWPPRKALEARCELPEDEAHAEPPPGTHCPCGIYAAADRPTLQDLAHPDLGQPLVVGEVAVWGPVIPAARGFRAQYAVPRRLWLVRESLSPVEPLGWPGDLPSTLGRTYRVPVELCDASWAVSPEAQDLWPTAEAERAERLEAHDFRDRWERLAAAKAAGEDIYRRELADFTRTTDQRSRPPRASAGPAMGTREAYWASLTRRY